MKSYGIDKIEINNSKIDSHIENLSRMGYSREENIFQSHDCENFIRMIYDVYAKQENDFGKDIGYLILGLSIITWSLFIHFTN
uniref:hypothetical protein n=1 Tax=Roseivirga sp. TaxID=1964215 RepID=UPI0040472EF9